MALLATARICLLFLVKWGIIRVFEQRSDIIQLTVWRGSLFSASNGVDRAKPSRYQCFNPICFYNYLCGHVSLNSRDTFSEMHCLAISMVCEPRRVHLHQPRWYSLLYTSAIWCCLWILGYKPVQHGTVLNTVGNCTTMVFVYIHISKHSSEKIWDKRQQTVHPTRHSPWRGLAGQQAALGEAVSEWM